MTVSLFSEAIPAILIVDDDEVMRMLLRQFLEGEGYAVTEAEDGQAALERLAERSYDLVILDVNLPEIDGWTVLQRLRAESATRIMMLTAHGRLADRVKGLDLGADSGRVQLTLTTYLLAVAIGQLLYGPVSDMVGRKRPLYVGLALFTVASIGCALAPDLWTLSGFRMAAAFGGSAGMVVPRAVVRDLAAGAADIWDLSYSR